ncbi:MAG: hypothetical protein V1882_05960 [Candidatus Omnitrophota bacterium]
MNATGLKLSRETNKLIFDWSEFMLCVFEKPAEREKIGPAWLLLFDIYFHSDASGIYSAAYLDLAKRYGVSPITVKKWKRHLCRNAVIDSFNHGRRVVFRLLPPYLCFLKTGSPKKDSDTTKNQVLQAVLQALKESNLTTD